MIEDQEKIQQLERELDEAMAKVFDLENRVKRDVLLRYELEEMLRSIYRDCREVLKAKEEEKPTLEKVLEHLSENIRKLARDYRFDL
jgi:chromosome segregation ATPase